MTEPVFWRIGLICVLGTHYASILGPLCSLLCDRAHLFKLARWLLYFFMQ